MKGGGEGIQEGALQVKWMPRETVVGRCRVCMVGEAMKQFAIEGIDHMG